MTKAQLIKAMEHIPDDEELYYYNADSETYEMICDVTLLKGWDYICSSGLPDGVWPCELKADKRYASESKEYSVWVIGDIGNNYHGRKPTNA